MESGLAFKVIGSVMILMGILCIWIGDRELPKKGMLSSRIQMYPPGTVRWLKWPMGLALIGAGIAVVGH